MILSSTTRNGGVILVFNDLEEPMIIEGLEAGSVIGGSQLILCSLNTQNGSRWLPPLLQTPAHCALLEVWRTWPRSVSGGGGRGDLSCTWGVFGVQLVFFSGMQIQMSSMCKDRGVICSQGGIYVWPEAPTLTSMCREKVHRWRSLGDDGVVTGTNETAGAQQCWGIL